MKITFLTVGSPKKAYIRDGLEEYLKRIKRYSALETAQVKEETSSVKIPREDVLKKEAANLLKKMNPADYKVVLSDKGRDFTSKAFAVFIEGLMSGGKKGVTFVIGGAYGLHETVSEQADLELSLSRMTLPHELCYLVLAEQVYRAFTIIKGEPYSH